MSEQVDHYAVLGVEPSARQEAVAAAFEAVLATRKARRAKTSDVHAAYAIIGDVHLRRAYDLARFGRATSERLECAKGAAIEIVRDAMPDVTWSEVRQDAWRATLRATVLVAGTSAKVSDFTGTFARRLQVLAARKLDERSANSFVEGVVRQEREEVGTESVGELLDTQ